MEWSRFSFNKDYNTAEKCFPIFSLCLEPFNNTQCKYSRLLPHWHSALANRSALCQCAATWMDNANDMNEQLLGTIPHDNIDLKRG